MENASRVMLASLLLLVIAASIVVLADVYYPEWSIVYEAGDYEALYAWSIEGDLYDEVVYTTVELNNTSTSNLDIGVVAHYLNGTEYWNLTLDFRSQDYVRGCFPDPTSDYLIVVGYSPITLTSWDGIVLAINRTDPVDWSGVYFDDNGKNEFFRGVYVAGDGSIYVVGEYYNGSWYYGLIVKYNNYSLNDGVWTAYTTRNYNLTLYDAVIGPDGFLYVTGHTLYRYVDSNTGDVYYIPVHQVVYKLDPNTLDLVNSTYIPLYTSQGYVNIVNTMKVDIANCGDGICIAGFYYDETVDPYNPTLGLLVVKLDSSFNKIWEKKLATTYQELAHGIASDVSGNIIVVGKTNNDYGSNLDTSYYHILGLVFDSNGNLVQAFLAGGDNGDLALDSTIDFNGDTYIAGAQYSTTLTYYNITENITITLNPTPIQLASREPSTLQVIQALKIPGQPTIKPETLSLKTQSTIKTTKTVIPTQPLNQPIIQQQPPTPAPIPLQVGTNDNALIAALGYYLDPLATPPTPIPEPALIPIILLITTLIVLHIVKKLPSSK